MAPIVNEKGHEDFRTSMSDDHIVSVGRKALSKEELQEMVYDKYTGLSLKGSHLSSTWDVKPIRDVCNSSTLVSRHGARIRILRLRQRSNHLTRSRDNGCWFNECLRSLNGAGLQFCHSRKYRLMKEYV